MHQFLITLLLCLGAPLCLAQHEHLLAALRSSEEKLYSAIEQNNLDVMDQFLHRNFAVQSADFFQSKSAALEKLRNGHSQYQVFRPQDDSVVVVNRKLVIASGKERYVRNTGENSGQEQYRHFLHVWVWHKKAWVLACRYISA